MNRTTHKGTSEVTHRHFPVINTGSLVHGTIVTINRGSTLREPRTLTWRPCERKLSASAIYPSDGN